MACISVPHIVLHVSCLTRTSGGYFRPSDVRFRGTLALSGVRSSKLFSGYLALGYIRTRNMAHFSNIGYIA